MEAQKISGPFTHQNLSVFLLHGEARVEERVYFTLQEAMEREALVVHETGTVSELEVENVSEDTEIYLEAGEIVKGGKQDRVLVADVVVPIRSGRVKTPAFCVEEGRWGRRGREAAASFSTSTTSLSSRDLKMSTRRKKDQRAVWSSVTGLQEKLARRLGKGVCHPESGSSLQLTLEDESVREKVKEYTAILAPILDDRKDVVGFAFAVNGAFNSASLYASGNLFKKLWPKLLEASAVEALAEAEEGETDPPPTPDEVSSLLASLEEGKEKEEKVTERIHLVTRESETGVLFETRDAETPSPWLHRNYIKGG
ncbi:MAG: ARPP-1 family domain-containing protein [Planctomycetota bacterium]